MTNVENLLKSLIGFYTRKSKNGLITTTSSWVSFTNVSTPAQLLYVSNTSTKTLLITQDAGLTYFALGAGQIFVFNNVSDLSSVAAKIEDNTAGIIVTFRYEY